MTSIFSTISVQHEQKKLKVDKLNIDEVNFLLCKLLNFCNSFSFI